MPRQLLQTQQFLAWNTFLVRCFWAWAYYSITNYRFICHRPEIYPILASKTSWNMILSLWGQATRQGPFFREFGRFNDSNRFILCTLMHVFLWGAILVHWHHQRDSHSKAYIWWHHIAWLVTENTKWIQTVFSTIFHKHILLSGSRLVRHACSSYMFMLTTWFLIWANDPATSYAEYRSWREFTMLDFNAWKQTSAWNFALAGAMSLSTGWLEPL